jgi:two-component system OmpR family response regulator
MTKTVLLVDYDPRSIDGIRRALSTLGVRTVLATDGETGVREFHRARPDLTLVQEVIPKMRGIDLCRALKSCPEAGHQPVILLACARGGARARMLASRCDDLIEKPFDEATLLAKVRKFVPALYPLASSLSS